jgi:hypothetical protein
VPASALRRRCDDKEEDEEEERRRSLAPPPPVTTGLGRGGTRRARGRGCGAHGLRWCDAAGGGFALGSAVAAMVSSRRPRTEARRGDATEREKQRQRAGAGLAAAVGSPGDVEAAEEESKDQGGAEGRKRRTALSFASQCFVVTGEGEGEARHRQSPRTRGRDNGWEAGGGAVWRILRGRSRTRAPEAWALWFV